MFAKESKCTIGGRSVEYLGYIICEEGVRTDPSKIEAIRVWPPPKTLKQLRGFLGLAGYYRRFIRSFGILAKPLTNLLKKDAFQWGSDAQEAFERLKQALSSSPVLALPDLTKPFVVETDASAGGLGVVLMQQHHPIAFISKALAPKHQALSNGSAEFKAPSDTKSDDPVTTQVVSEAHGDSQHFQYGWYRPGAFLLQRVIRSQKDDSQLQTITTQLKEGKCIKDWKWKEQWLTKKGRMVVGSDISLREEIVRICHASSMGGHSGVTATIQRVKGIFYWKGITKVVKRIVRGCDICMRAKHENVASPGLLQPLPIPDAIFSDISMDFIGGLPRVNGKDTIFVVVDRLTKYGHFMLLGHPFTAKDVAQVFLDNAHIRRLLTECLEGRRFRYLRMYGDGTDLPEHGSKGNFGGWWYSTTFHSSLGRSPYEALYGYPPPLHIPYVPKDISDGEANEMMRNREVTIKLLKKSLCTAQNRMRQQANKKRSERVFETGTWVYLKLQPYMQKSLRVNKHSKLTPKYFGPFLVVEKVGEVAYRLDLPDEAQIHPVFHVSLLKQASGPPDTIIPLPQDARFHFQPEAVLDKQMVKRNKRMAMKVLVHWKGQRAEDATWEFLDEFQLRFPDFADYPF
ncbi:putative nucleotidyltransferase, ribonuclease H [Tanacetum coccineum]